MADDRNLPAPDGRITPSGWRNIDESDSSRRTQLHLIGLGVLMLATVLFIALNSKEVETRFIFFSVTTRLWVGLLVVLVFGIVVGWFLHVWFARRNREG